MVNRDITEKGKGMIIISITGGMGVGKTTAIDLIRSEFNHAEVVPFAKPLKTTAYEMGWNGKKDKKGRKLLQLLGTEVGRNLIDPDIWVKKWKRNVDLIIADRVEHGNSPALILCDDIRFNNEAKYVKDNFGYIIKLTSRHNGRTVSSCKKVWNFFVHRIIGIGHKSERGIDHSYVDFMVRNNGSILDLKSRLVNIVSEIERQHGTQL